MPEQPEHTHEDKELGTQPGDPDSSPLSSVGEGDVTPDGLKSRRLSKSGSPRSPTKPPTPIPRRSGRKVSQPKPLLKKEEPVAVRRAPKKSKWNAENIMTDPKSPLSKTDLRKLLLNPAAWDVLDDNEKAEIIALFPDDQHILGPSTADARPDTHSLQNDDAFRADCAAYVQHVAEGQFDSDWLQCAWSAHERRKMGDFDDFLNRKFERDWETKLPEELIHRREQPKIQVIKDLEVDIAKESETSLAYQENLQTRIHGGSNPRDLLEVEVQDNEERLEGDTAKADARQQSATEQETGKSVEPIVEERKEQGEQRISMSSIAAFNSNSDEDTIMNVASVAESDGKGTAITIENQDKKPEEATLDLNGPAKEEENQGSLTKKQGSPSTGMVATLARKRKISTFHAREDSPDELA